jgi:protein-S-isoprenylcysteine O-methyltransferase Ste14
VSTRIKLARFAAFPLIGVAMVTHHTFSETSFLDVFYEVTGYALLAAGAVGRLWCAAFISGRKNAELVTDGPYSVVRNPLYFFSFLGFIGAGLAFESITLALAFGLVFFATHWPTILREEKRLRQLFGEAFQRYSMTVPRFVPRPWKLHQPASVSISTSLFSRAVLESTLVLGVFLAAQLVERVHVDYPASILLRLP